MHFLFLLLLLLPNGYLVPLLYLLFPQYEHGGVVVHLSPDAGFRHGEALFDLYLAVVLLLVLLDLLFHPAVALNIDLLTNWQVIESDDLLLASDLLLA